MNVDFAEASRRIEDPRNHRLTVNWDDHYNGVCISGAAKFPRKDLPFIRQFRFGEDGEWHDVVQGDLHLKPYPFAVQGVADFRFVPVEMVFETFLAVPLRPGFPLSLDGLAAPARKRPVPPSVMEKMLLRRMNKLQTEVQHFNEWASTTRPPVASLPGLTLQELLNRRIVQRQGAPWPEERQLQAALLRPEATDDVIKRAWNLFAISNVLSG